MNRLNFQRIQGTVDPYRMQDSEVTFVGGAFGLAVDSARCGLGQLKVVDFDTVTATNPARQDFSPGDVGGPKVEAVARNVRTANPGASVICHAIDYCSLSDEEHDQRFGSSDAFVFATDSHRAQAKGSYHAARLGKAALFLGLYREGRAGEIVLFVPGVTRACYRCCCSDRYEVASRAPVDIPSVGATIFDLRIIDGIAGQLLLGILNQGEDNRMGGVLPWFADRNLISIKIAPDYELGDLFTGAGPSVMSVAQQVAPEPGCPDCRLVNEALGLDLVLGGEEFE